MRRKCLEYQRTGLLLLALILAPAIGAQDAARPVITMPYSEFYPYTFSGQNDAPEGFTIDIVTRLASHQGYDVAFVKSSNPRHFFELLDRGEVQLTPLLALTPERIERGLPTQRLGSYEVIAFVREGSSVKSVAALSGQRIGAVAGSVSRKVADDIPDAEVRVYDRTDDLILPLLLGEIDAVVSVADIFSERLRKASVDDRIKRLDETLLSIPYGFIVSPDLPDVQAALNTAIDEVLQPAALERLKDRWFGRDQTLTEHPWFRAVALGAGLAAVLVLSLLLVANRLHRQSGRLLAENGANRLLIGSLDSVNAAVAIFDQDMKAVHWNEGFEQHFQKRVDMATQDLTLPKLLRAAEQYEVAETPGRDADTAAETGSVEQQVRAGQTVYNTYRFSEGDMFDVRFFPLGRDHFAMIGVDLTLIDAQREQIISQAAQLERRNEQLSAFSSIAAHDLRAPLIRQRALLEFIAEDLGQAGIALPQNVQANVDLITELSDGMSNLIVDLLDYATAEALNDAPKLVQPNARIAALLPFLPDREGLTVHIAQDMPDIWVNPTAFDTVMRNLISNAINHHDGAKGKVQVRAGTQDGKVILEVQDDGPGIPLEARELIFDPFKKLGSSGSSGLGLSVVKSSVMGWGGEITVHDAKPRGTLFMLSAPCPPAGLVEGMPDAA